MALDESSKSSLLGELGVLPCAAAPPYKLKRREMEILAGIILGTILAFLTIKLMGKE